MKGSSKNASFGVDTWVSCLITPTHHNNAMSGVLWDQSSHFLLFHCRSDVRPCLSFAPYRPSDCTGHDNAVSYYLLSYFLQQEVLAFSSPLLHFSQKTMCFLLAFYLINTATGQSLHHVCGSDYDDASYNCMKNPRCPNGDGCPADKATCFALPEDACLSLTESPTPSPAEATNNIITTMPTISHRDAIKTDVAFNKAPKHVFVCGDDYNDAATKCMSNQKCSNGDECAFKTTCYAIPAETCDNNTPSSVQGGSYVASAIEILAPSPSVTSFDGYTRHPTETFTAQPVANTTLSPSYAALNTSSPTLAPTQNTRFCGTNYTNAVDNCAVERACVDGFECGVGETVSLPTHISKPVF